MLPTSNTWPGSLRSGRLTFAERGAHREGEMKLKTLCNPKNAISPPQGLDKGNILSISEHLPSPKVQPQKARRLMAVFPPKYTLSQFPHQMGTHFSKRGCCAVGTERGKEAICCFRFCFWRRRKQKKRLDERQQDDNLVWWGTARPARASRVKERRAGDAVSIIIYLLASLKGPWCGRNKSLKNPTYLAAATCLD